MRKETRWSELTRMVGVMELLCFCLASVAMAQSAAPTSGKRKDIDDTYYLLVFSKPVAGMEAEYNRWYTEQHQKDVVSVPGFLTAQRFVLSDVQLRDSKQLLPKYFVIYKISTDNLPAVYTEVNRRLKTGETKLSPAFDQTTAQGFTYRPLGPVIHPRHGTADAPKDDAQVYYQLVFSDPAAGLEDGYNKWYDEQHAPDVVSAPGFVEARRLVFNDVQLNAKTPPTKYLAVFTIQSDDIAARFADFKRLAPTMPMSPAMGMSYGYTYKAMGPMVFGDQVRAERAKHSGAK